MDRSTMRLPWGGRFVMALLLMLLSGEGMTRVVVVPATAPVLRWHDFSSQLKVAQMEELGAADVVVVGTSMAQQDLVPSVLSEGLGGAEVYNAGLNGGVPVVMEPWLIDHVAPRLEPTTVLWGLSPLDLSAVYGAGTKNAYDEASATRPGTLAAIDRWSAQYSTVIASRSVIRDPSKLFGAEADQRRDRHGQAVAMLGPSGERLDFSIETGSDRGAEIRGRLNPFRIDRDDLAAIARAVVELQGRGVRVVFVELPVPDRLVLQLPNGEPDRELSTRAIRALGSELGVPVIVVDGEFGDDDFVDFTHLDQSGAHRLSVEVATQLAAL